MTNPDSLMDSMESFFISETLVYLYLTVVERDVINQRVNLIKIELRYSLLGFFVCFSCH